ncbi:MAG: NAD(P)-binding protein [Desulfomicrobiaceae bacterium]|nr:NAD(P)-binding protein [Desulfomicrobiaceae bacterium]
MEQVRYLIIGAGPTGLGAGVRLRQLGIEDFLLLERHDYAGGLSASFRDAAGFTWDIGGHVVFSRLEPFLRLLDQALGEDAFTHQRRARVRLADRWIPYPFQNNIRHLPKELVWECVQGLLASRLAPQEAAHFGQWMEAVFGAGITRLFMQPYNFKVWATPAEAMDFRWIGERVAVVDLADVLRRIILEEDATDWGPNAVFRFPKHGGTGAIFRRIAEGIAEHIRYQAPVHQVDWENKIVTYGDGHCVGYGDLLTTMPLDLFVSQVMHPKTPHLVEAARLLEHNGVCVSGIGIAGLREDPTCWMYFPESNCPFYRVTNFHNYSPFNVAEPGKQMAFMSETSFSRHKPENLDALEGAVIQGLQNVTLMHAEDTVVTRWEHRVDYGYPVPTLGRDRALATIQPWLEARHIFSRGRFGGWKYEVANMDHSVVQGMQWAERMVLGTAEQIYQLPQ